MTSFDFDMAFPATELAEGLRALFARQPYEWVERIDGDRYEYAVTFPSGHCALLSLGPLPEERRTPTPFSDRTLLTARSVGASADELEALRREIVQAFMRVMG